MDFLGYRIFPSRLGLARRSKVRFARKFRRYERAFLRGQWSELRLQQRMQALLAFVLQADSWAYRCRVLQRFGVVAQGLEPGDPGRQLEQQRQELPGHEPQQQLAGQQEQQQRVPVRPPPSSIPRGGTDPAAILSCEGQREQAKTVSPPGVSSPAGWLGRTLWTGDFQPQGERRDLAAKNTKNAWTGNGPVVALALWAVKVGEEGKELAAKNAKNA